MVRAGSTNSEGNFCPEDQKKGPLPPGECGGIIFFPLIFIESPTIEAVL